MNQGILADYHADGRVVIIGKAEIDFDRELLWAVTAHKLTDLVGWGKWRALYRLEYDAYHVTHAVYATTRNDNHICLAG